MVESRVKTRIADLDRPLHRIFPVWHLERLCRLRQLVLVKPSLWIDPREDPCATFVLTPKPGSGPRPQRPVADYLAACWAQSWSYEANSDVLLRAYSRVVLDPLIQRNTTPAEEGVRVTTTARHLIAALEGWASRHVDCHFYIAPVTYEADAIFGQGLVNRLSRPEGPRYFGSPDGRAESLFVKREQFRDEDEVRILCVSTEKFAQGESVRSFAVDPNSLFVEVSFDPRLMPFERSERGQKLRSEGYAGAIRHDPSYVAAYTLVPMENGWPDPD